MLIEFYKKEIFAFAKNKYGEDYRRKKTRPILSFRTK